MQTIMNIVFFSSLDPNDINNWSGTTWHILKSLEKKHRITVIGTQMISQTVNFVLKNFSIKNTHGGRYSLLFGKLCSELINRVPDCDLVFMGDLQLSPYLEIDVPLVHLSDVNYHLFKNYESKSRTDFSKWKSEKDEQAPNSDKTTNCKNSLTLFFFPVKGWEFGCVNEWYYNAVKGISNHYF